VIVVAREHGGGSNRHRRVGLATHVGPYDLLKGVVMAIDVPAAFNRAVRGYSIGLEVELRDLLPVQQA
jgi:hypothetical protein